jgi:hypothetical protein
VRKEFTMYDEMRGNISLKNSKPRVFAGISLSEACYSFVV